MPFQDKLSTENFITCPIMNLAKAQHIMGTCLGRRGRQLNLLNDVGEIRRILNSFPIIQKRDPVKNHPKPLVMKGFQRFSQVDDQRVLHRYFSSTHVRVRFVRSIKNREYDPLRLEKPMYRAFSACSGDWGKRDCQKYKNLYF
jgi:hypothetical protein